MLIGCVARRAAIWSLAIVFFVERLLGSTLSGIAQLSPMWESRAVFAGLGPGTDDLQREGIPEGWGAVVRLAIITVVMLLLASWRLRHLRLTGRVRLILGPRARVGRNRARRGNPRHKRRDCAHTPARPHQNSKTSNVVA